MTSIVLAGSLVLSVYFVNCGSSGLPPAASSGSTSASSVNMLGAVANPPSILVGGQSQIQVSGGVPPYQFLINQGTGTVSSAGLLQAPSSAGPIVVAVHDSQNGVAYVSISVNSSSQSSCTTAWGAIVPNGGQVTGYAAASVDCPNSCQQETLTCQSGTLAGGGFTATAGSCSVKSCVFKQASGYLQGSQVSQIPSSCAGSTSYAYHSYVWMAASGGSLAAEYKCVGPNETP